MRRFKTLQVGAKNTLDYRVYLTNEFGKVVSPFHDVPLHCEEDDNGFLHMVVEVPRHSQAKLEISKEEPMNPIKQDVKKGVLRYVKNVFPYHGYLWNYGALPQTWESPNEKDSRTGLPGDNDPIDVIDIGSDRVAHVGEVRTVKILGCLAMIDEGETDWKVIAIDTEDSMAPLLNDVSDLQLHCPGLVDATLRWFRLYKVPDGKGPNSFAANDSVFSRDQTLDIIKCAHQHWRSLWCPADGGKLAQKHGISLGTKSDTSSTPKDPTAGSDGSNGVANTLLIKENGLAVEEDEEEPAEVARVFYPEAMLAAL
jgi:inorganic pyrophosphatase